MTIRRLSVFLVAMLAILFLSPASALACACCSEEGEYRISFRKPQASELGLLRELRFGTTAHLIETAANAAESAKSPGERADNYVLNALLTGNLWKLDFREGSASGTLNLPLPPKMLSYVADTHDGQKSAGGGPMLYKEWRFEGRVTGTGIFRPGTVTPTKYFLVLHGRGNRCDSAADFSHWRLELNGARARYAFYGQLVQTP